MLNAIDYALLYTRILVKCIFIFNLIACGRVRYWRYNEDIRSMDPGYPKPITIWKGIPDSPQGAFVDKANGASFSFHVVHSVYCRMQNCYEKSQFLSLKICM